MSLEELVDVEVTSVSKKREPRLEAAAAIYVITQEDIRRSGATTLAEALRLAPGVQVARINASQWAIGIRGFASRLSRSLLVLIDGRSVYTPLFAGVYWEAQDTLLEDVDRIEVIRGPGGALWGANAVNGVINIITKSAVETRGGFASAGAGSEERALAAFRYGGAITPDVSYRVYAKYDDRDAAFHADGSDFDAWRMGQVGVRSDAALGAAGSLSLQANAYDSQNGERTSISSYAPPYITTVDRKATLSGGDVLGRWSRALAGGGEASLQAYYDRTHHAEPTFQENRDTFDVDFQHRFRLPLGQETTWGVGFRSTSGDTSGVPTIVFSPPSRTDRLFSAFVQDEVPLVKDRLRLTLGSKLEHNDYSGFEVQPSIRLLWVLREGQVAWAAVSRAVRTPSRVEHDLSLTAALSPASPTFAQVLGDAKFVSEKVVAYEAGYRLQATRRVLVDVAAFYNRYEDLLSVEPGAPFVEAGRRIFPFSLRNGISGRTRGFEIAADAVAGDRIKVRASYSYLAMDLKPQTGSADRSTGPSAEGSSPRHGVQLTGHASLPRELELDATARYVDRIPAQRAAGYFNLDLRLGWRPDPSLEMSLVGQGLFHARHLEFSGGSGASTEIQRGIYGKLSWRF
jgi:iron complex outermembrane receptor protein